MNIGEAHAAFTSTNDIGIPIEEASDNMFTSRTGMRQHFLWLMDMGYTEKQVVDFATAYIRQLASERNRY